MKYLVLLCDGMSDYKIESLGNKTIIEYASTSNFDMLIKNGQGVKIYTTPKGMPPGSDICNLSIFGYNPLEYYTGRSPLEALSMGIKLNENDTAFRVNIVAYSLDYKKMDDFSAFHIDNEIAKDVISELNKFFKDEPVEFYYGLGYRNLMVVRGRDFDINTTPPHDIMGSAINDYLPKGRDASFIIDIMERAKNIFKMAKYGKANGIWIWGEGKRPKLKPFKERFGVIGSVISAVHLVRGIGISVGLNIIDVPGATGFIDTNYRGKAEYAINSLRSVDYVYLHVEAPDEAGHMGSIEEKVKAVENINNLMLPIIINGLKEIGDEYRLLITPDHPTPISVRSHVAEPVPAILYGSGVEVDDNEYYSENIKPFRVFYDGYNIADYLINNVRC
ncbi:MAG: cofactor-independent phosphoglycerate mutase [Deferribacterota bacterium]|nr:cofactor-independent phosphoglycerate mutase [Deferribacterota bacterium]